MDIQSLSKLMLGLIEKSGADEGEVFIQGTDGLEIIVRDQTVERLRNKATAGYALRLIVDGRMSFVHSSDLRVASLESAIDNGVKLAKTASPDESNYLADPVEREVQVETYDGSAQEIPLKRKVNLLKDIETIAFAYDPCISKVESLHYDDAIVETVVTNTKGILKRDRSSQFSVSVSVVAEKDGDVETGGEWVNSRFFDDLGLPSEIARRACQKAAALVGGRSLPTQAAPVIFDRDVGFTLLRHLFEMVNGENVASGISMLGDRVGEQIGSSLVTVVDDPTIRGGIGSRMFDDEGIPSSRTVLVDRGVLKSFLFDTRTGRKTGSGSTGNAKRDNLRSLPTVGHTNLFIDRGDVSPKEILSSTGKGLWLISLAGWWVGMNPSTGDFSSGAKGLWVDGGEVAYPVKNVTVASNLLEMLAGVDAVGDDLYFRHETVSPTMRIGGMQVGGT